MSRLAALIIILATLAAMPPARAEDFMLKPIGLADGLSQSSARSLLRDNKGYLWIGTDCGLNRYDQTGVKTYFSTPDKTGSLADNSISLVTLAPGGDLLVATGTGLHRYDYSTDTFEPITLNGKPLAVSSAIADRSGLLLGGKGALYEYHPATRSVREVEADGGSDHTYINIVGPYKSKLYLLHARRDGVWIYDSVMGTLRPLPFFTGKGVRAIELDDEGHLWIASNTEGLQVYDTAGSLIKTFGDDELSSPIVLDMLHHGKEMWVATERGLNIINPHTYAVHPLPNPSRGALHGTILTLADDKGGNVYAGTLRHGVVCVYSVPMRTYTSLTRRSHEGFIVTSLLQLPDGRILVGTDGEGVATFDPADGSFSPFPSTAGLKVTSLANCSHGRVIVTSYDRGIWILDPADGALKPAPEAYATLSKASGRTDLAVEVFALAGSRRVAVMDKVYTLDEEGATLHTPPQNVLRGRVSEKLHPFYNDSAQVMMHDTRGIYRYNALTDSVAALFAAPADASLTCAAYDGRNTVYGSTGDIVYRHDIRAAHTDTIRNPHIRNITTLAVEGDRLWIGADNRLYMVKGPNFSVFTGHDGVAPNQFINKAWLLTDDYLFLGGFNGLLKIGRADMDRLIEHENLSTISLSELAVDGRFTAPDQNGVYRIPNDYMALSLTIVDNDSEGIRNKLFRYYLEGNGASDEPIETFDRKISLSMPGYGSYTVKVAYSQTDGSWSTPLTVATLRVAPPWWGSPWFVGCVMAVVVCAAIAIYFLRRARRRGKLAEDRSHTLQQSVDVMRKAQRDVRTPMMLVMSPLHTLIDNLKKGKDDRESTMKALEEIYRQSLQMRQVIDVVPGAPLPAPATAEEPQRLTDAAPTGTQAEETETEEAQLPSGSRSVVIVEENPELRHYIASQLRKTFGVVKTVAKTSEAFTAIQNLEPDIVIIDSESADSAGSPSAALALCESVRSAARLRHIPVVMLSTASTEEEKADCYVCGADCVITKPFHIEVLETRCNNLLRNRAIMRSRYRTDPDAPRPAQSINNSDESFILEVDKHIGENLYDPDFGVEELARKMLMSRTTLYMRLSRLTGKSVGAYISDRRLVQAREALTSTDLPINEIAENNGFRSQRYFSTFFKEKTGLSPSQYRTAHRK